VISFVPTDRLGADKKIVDWIDELTRRRICRRDDMNNASTGSTSNEKKRRLDRRAKEQELSIGSTRKEEQLSPGRQLSIGSTRNKKSVDWIDARRRLDRRASGSLELPANKVNKSQERSERMSASASSNTSFGSRRSATNSRSDGRSNCRSDRTNLHDEFNGIKFVFGRPDQVSMCLQSMKKLADCAGTKMNNNMHKLVKKKVEATFPKPKAPGEDPAKHVVDECRELMKRKLDKEDECNEDKAKLFRIIMTQCSPEMKDKLEAQSTELEKLEDDNDVIGLLDMIKELVCNAGGVRNKFIIMQSLNRTLHGSGNTQRPNESPNECDKRFPQQVEVVEAAWGKLVPPCHENDNTKDQESAHNQCLASLFLGGTDQARCKAAVDELNNNCVLGEDVCPADVPAAIMVLTNHRGHGGSRQRQVEDLSGGLSVVSFAQQPGRRRGKTKRFRCNQEGHLAKDCTAMIEGSESKRGGSDDNGSVGSSGGKAAWNFSQVERGVKC